MPNPLMHKQYNTSDAKMAHHPGQIQSPTGGRATSPPDKTEDASDPIQYNQAGNGPRSHNIAYRGVEQHGVDNSTQWMEPVPEGLVLPDEYVEPDFVAPKEPPVKVQLHRGFIDWNSRNYPVSEVPTRALGRRDQRITLQIDNNDAANDVFVGSDESISSQFSGKIGPGKSLRLENSQAAVWVVCAATKTALVSIFEEYISDPCFDLGS